MSNSTPDKLLNGLPATIELNHAAREKITQRQRECAGLMRTLTGLKAGDKISSSTLISNLALLAAHAEEVATRSLAKEQTLVTAKCQTHFENIGLDPTTAHEILSRIVAINNGSDGEAGVTAGIIEPSPSDDPGIALAAPDEPRRNRHQSPFNRPLPGNDDDGIIPFADVDEEHAPHKHR